MLARPARASYVAVVLASCVLASCGSSSDETPAIAGSVSKDVGPEGATLVVEGATVTIPPGALTGPKKITIRAKNGGAPPGFTVMSRVYECEPSGTDFAKAVTMQMPFTDNGKGNATMFWSSGADPAFKDVGGRVEGNTMIATVLHFSSGFVAEKK